jgi:hypothetical protein
LKRLGWVIPADFVQDIRGTNIAQDKYYDQIAILPRPGRFQIAQLDGGRPAAGAFNYYDLVYRPTADFETYRPVMEAHEPQAKRSNFTFNDEGKARTEEEQKRWYRQYWRTYQMSDHLPLWVALRTDNADDFLTDRLKEANQG